MKIKLLFIFLSVHFISRAVELPCIGGPTYMSQAINEEQKINQLILFVEKADAVFIRNGTEYPAKEAAKHLRMKREKAGSKIKTAKEFIDYIASKSSMSGEPYKMKFKNGSSIPVRDILYHELKKIEARQVGLYKGFKLVKSPAC